MFSIDDVKHIEYDLINSICTFKLNKSILIKNKNKNEVSFKMSFEDFTQKAQKLSDYNKEKSKLS